MSVITVHTAKGVGQIEFEGNPILIELLAMYGMVLPHSCGCNGVCHACNVLVNGQLMPACQVRLRGDRTIILPESPDFYIP